MPGDQGDVEGDGDEPRLVLSMRAKVSILGLCFVLLLALIAFLDVPHFAEAVRSLGQAVTLVEPPVENESQPPEKEPQPSSGDYSLGRASASRATAIRILADGNIVTEGVGPYSDSSARIHRVGNVYTLWGDIYSDSIWVERDNIVIDGQGFTIEGSLDSYNAGILLDSRNNVTVRDLTVKGFENGITARRSENCTIADSTIQGIGTEYLLSGQPTGYGISSLATDSIIIKNVMVTGFETGIRLFTSNNTVITDNTVSDNELGIEVSDHEPFDNGTVSALALHNNFIDNTRHAQEGTFWNGLYLETMWDGGHPSGGNYWDDYTGWDNDGDGIGDTPYIIDEITKDRYPLMKPWTGVAEPALPFLLSIPGLVLLPALQREQRR